jgi:antitoxin CcdA
MHVPINASAPKKPTNLSINSDLLAAARELKINLSATLEEALIQEVKALMRKHWLEENKEAIDACNDFVEKMDCLQINIGFFNEAI